MADKISPYAYPGTTGFVSVDYAIREAIGKMPYTEEEVRSKSRSNEIVQWRAALCAALRAYGLSYSEIGKKLNRDHSSAVYHALRHVENLKYWQGYKDKFNVVLSAFEWRVGVVPLPKERKPRNEAKNRLDGIRSSIHSDAE